MTLDIGVIGCGGMGQEHVRTLTGQVSGARVVAVCDADAQRADAAAVLAGDARVHGKPSDLVGDPDVAAVLVASADETHEELVLTCVESGKPVLCEKPLATTSESCRRVLDAEQRAGRRLVQVGFMRRYDPSYREMKAALDDGAIGAPVFLHSVHRNADYLPHLPETALVTGTAVHDIDIARWLLGEEIVRATVHTPRRSASVRPDFQDTLFLVLQTESGVLVDVEVFVSAGYGYDVRGELVGESGTVTLQPPAAVLTRRAGSEARVVTADFRPRFAESYRSELQAWVDAAAAGTVDADTGASAWDGYAAAAVAEACLRALDSGAGEDVVVVDRPALYTP